MLLISASIGKGLKFLLFITIPKGKTGRPGMDQIHTLQTINHNYELGSGGREPTTGVGGTP